MSGYCPDCGNTLCLCDKITRVTYSLRCRITELENILGFLKDTLREIADEDFRGNRSNASVKAYQALKKIGSYKEKL